MDNQPDEFAILYNEHRKVLERSVHYKISNYADAEDILQDVLSAAYKRFDQLSDKSKFKQWIIIIASHKCIDYYKKKAANLDIPLEYISDDSYDFHGAETSMVVQDTLDKLADKDKQILYLFYINDFSLKDVATRLQIPIGTVKSRLNKAKGKFKELYLYPPIIQKMKGYAKMKHAIFPQIMPDCKIEKSDEKPFSVRFEEIAGWLITPRVGERSVFAFYDDPDHILTGVNKMECVRNAEIHGVPCVQVEVEAQDDNGFSNKTLFLRMTETHCMYIAETHIRNGTFYFGSFMDDEWLKRYEVGENNCGREIFQEPKGIAKINTDGEMIITKDDAADIIGRYSVTIGKRNFDTVALVNFEKGILVLQYIDRNGKTIIFRRYNKDDWKLDRYKESWTKKLPDSEKIIVNNEIYVHWYDCIPETVL